MQNSQTKENGLLRVNTHNPEPRLTGFLCKDGAHFFYDVSNPARRKLPISFIGLPITSVEQVQTAEVLKALLSGSDGVLIAGCDSCYERRGHLQFDQQFRGIQQALKSYEIDLRRLQLVWVSANEEDRFMRIVSEMMDTLRQLPKLRLPRDLGKQVLYCG